MPRFHKERIHAIFIASDERVAYRRQYFSPFQEGNAKVITAPPAVICVVWHFKFNTRREFRIVFENKDVGCEPACKKCPHNMSVIPIQIDRSEADVLQVRTYCCKTLLRQFRGVIPRNPPLQEYQPIAVNRNLKRKALPANPYANSRKAKGWVISIRRRISNKIPSSSFCEKCGRSPAKSGFVMDALRR
jgi:hypothetical protein